MRFIQNKMHIWYILLFLNATVAFWLSYFGVFTMIAKADHTYISFINIAIYVVSFFYIGWQLRKSSEYSLEEHLEPVWFASEQTLGLGLLGTILGLIFMLGSLKGMGTDAASIQAMINHIVTNMGLAFSATATGIVASLLLRTWVILFTRLVP
jgi:hypothetical protein